MTFSEVPRDSSSGTTLGERFRRGVAGVAVLVLCGACTQGPGSPNSSETFDLELVQVIESATAGGASDHQIAILTQAREAGALSTEAVREARGNAIDCMSGLGLTAYPAELTLDNGLELPGYTVQLGAVSASESELNSAEEVVDACDLKEFSWVNDFYQLQPAAREMTDAMLQRKAPELRACMEREGVMGGLGDDATPRELAEQAAYARFEIPGTADCLGEAGVGSF
jgi:hypothetical protein